MRNEQMVILTEMYQLYLIDFLERIGLIKTTIKGKFVGPDGTWYGSIGVFAAGRVVSKIVGFIFSNQFFLSKKGKENLKTVIELLEGRGEKDA